MHEVVICIMICIVLQGMENLLKMVCDFYFTSIFMSYLHFNLIFSEILCMLLMSNCLSSSIYMWNLRLSYGCELKKWNLALNVSKVKYYCCDSHKGNHNRCGNKRKDRRRDTDKKQLATKGCINPITSNLDWGLL